MTAPTEFILDSKSQKTSSTAILTTFKTLRQHASYCCRISIADWSEEFKNLIRHGTDLRPWSLYSLSVENLGWKSVPGFAAIGDAAHLTIPNGEGVNLAMIDSLRLATKIVEHGSESLDQTVREYEADMFPRGIATIAKGKVMANVMFSADAQASLQLMASEITAE